MPGEFAKSLRAIDGRCAFRFAWCDDHEHVWSRTLNSNGVSLKLCVRKANQTITLELHRESGDGDGWRKRIEVMSPFGLPQRLVEHVWVPAKQNNFGHVRLPHSYTEFERLFVDKGGFVIAF